MTAVAPGGYKICRMDILQEHDDEADEADVAM